MKDALSKAIEALEESKRQIEYLHDKFTATGTGNAVLAQITEALATLASLQQEPTLYQFRTRPQWDVKGWTAWKDCSPESYADYVRVPVLHDWLYEVRKLYTHPLAVAAEVDSASGRDAWISVEDRLPENGETVLGFWSTSSGVVHSGCWGTATFTNGRWRNQDDEDDLFSDPTFWQILPAAPAALAQKGGGK